MPDFSCLFLKVVCVRGMCIHTHTHTHTHMQIYKIKIMAQLVKNPPAMGDTWVPSVGLGRTPGEGNGYVFQYSGLENSMHRIVHGVAKSRIQLSDFHFHYWSSIMRL